MDLLIQTLVEQARFARVVRAVDNGLRTLVTLSIFSKQTNNTIRNFDLNNFTRRHYKDKSAKK